MCWYKYFLVCLEGELHVFLFTINSLYNLNVNFSTSIYYQLSDLRAISLTYFVAILKSVLINHLYLLECDTVELVKPKDIVCNCCNENLSIPMFRTEEYISFLSNAEKCIGHLICARLLGALCTWAKSHDSSKRWVEVCI